MLRTRTAIKLSPLGSTSSVAIGMRRSVLGIRLPAVGREQGQVGHRSSSSPSSAFIY
jgi:hypothetical protein